MKKIVITYVISFVVAMVVWLLTLYFVSTAHISPWNHNVEPLNGMVYWKMAIAFSAFISLYPTALFGLARKSQQTWDKIHEFEERLQLTNTIRGLDKLMDDIVVYRNSAACFSIQHMRGANKVAYATKIKIETILNVVYGNNSGHTF
jgi:hypothetical protein